MNLPAKQKQSHRQQTCGCREGGDFEEGRIRRLRLAIDANCYIGWINSKVLLHSTDNCIQYPVISYNGKEYEKKHTYV